MPKEQLDRIRQEIAKVAAINRPLTPEERETFDRAMAELPETHEATDPRAQALEALAWQAETGASVREMGSGGFFCAVNGDEIVNNYYADTPLGALLAAMEGERDGD